MGRRKRWVVLGFIVLAVTWGLAVWRVWFPGCAFDPAAWQDESQIEQGVRLGMADRLLARDALRGKTRAEVVGLLGEPTPTGHFSDWDLVYWLGPERGWIHIDSAWLVVRFDGDGRVAECRIFRD